MTAMRRIEKITMRIPGMPGMCSEPMTMGFSTKRSHSSITVTSAAPTMEPVTDPSPPMTTIIRTL